MATPSAFKAVSSNFNETPTIPLLTNHYHAHAKHATISRLRLPKWLVKGSSIFCLACETYLAAIVVVKTVEIVESTVSYVWQCIQLEREGLRVRKRKADARAARDREIAQQREDDEER
jgi:hypothetical protein